MLGSHREQEWEAEIVAIHTSWNSALARSGCERDPEQRQARWKTQETGFAGMDISSLGTVADRAMESMTTPGWQCRLHVIL